MGEALLVHPPADLRGSQTIAWTNLPSIQVKVSSCGDFSKTVADRIFNMLFFSLESLYNMPDELLNGRLQAATIFPRNQVKRLSY